MNYIREYHNKIVSGEIVVSKKIKRVYELLVDRLDNPGKFHFDIDRANQPIKFIEKYCRNSKGTWIGQRIELVLFQKANDPSDIRFH